jgi:mannose-1-phosphate guanylyltransferase
VSRRPAQPSHATAAALIIAGGQGTRFWPASRLARPKPLFSVDARGTLLSATIDRLQPLISRDRIFVLVPGYQMEVFAQALNGVLAPANLLREPQARGTAVAVAYGAAAIRQRLGDGLVAVMPADHYITPASAFRATLGRAFALARRHPAIVVIGVPPTRPDTGYGYQEVGTHAGPGYRVRRFVEKPAPAAARAMVRSGRFLWNAGMFVFSQQTLAEQLTAHVPELARRLEGLIRQAPGWEGRYARLRFDSFDREVLEKSREILGVRATFKWDDVGSWNGLWEALRGRDGNALAGNVLALDASRVLARSDGRLMVLLGVTDLIAVDTGDALLIAARERAQDVRRVIGELKRRGLDTYL